MGINARSALHPRWRTFAAKTLSGFAWTYFQIVDPHTITSNTDFNAWTNHTESDPEILWEGWGQMQVYRQTLAVEIPAGGITQLRSLRFTVPNSADIPPMPVRKGLRIIVTDIKGGGDEDVMKYTYTVTSGVTATLSWTRTIDAEVDTGRVVA